MNEPATRKRDALNHPLLHLSDTDLAVLLNLDNHLRRLQFLATHNPLYYWLAIDLCITAKRQFPDWIRDYLGKCAHNWTLAQNEERKGKEERDRKAKQARRFAKAKQKAKRAPDIREKVLEILGFPKNTFGPGSLLDPNYGASRRMQEVLFTWRFAELFDQSKDKDSVKARRTAGQEVFGDGPDDKTLERCLKRQLQLKCLPRATEEWKSVIDRYRVAMKAMRLRMLEPEPSDQRP
jgi:hypothetical protein